MYSQYCCADEETQSGQAHCGLPPTLGNQLPVNVSEHLDQIKLIRTVVEVHIVPDSPKRYHEGRVINDNRQQAGQSS